MEALLASLLLTAREKEETREREGRQVWLTQGANEIAFEIAACVCLEGLERNDD
jgi:hypothetical protein